MPVLLLVKKHLNLQYVKTQEFGHNVQDELQLTHGERKTEKYLEDKRQYRYNVTGKESITDII